MSVFAPHLPLPWLLLAMTGLASAMLGLALRRERRRSRSNRIRLMQLGNQLELMHADLARRLDDQTAGLRAKVAALESFNRAVAHDLRGPLYGIEGLARLAREALLRSDAQAERMLQTIAHQASATLQLVDALMGLARAADAVLTLERVDSQRLAEEVVQQLYLISPQGHRALQLGPLPVVYADATLLRQVFVHLIGNALKFTQCCAAPHIEVQAWNDAGRVVFRVRDNGIGFSPSEAGQLFKPFKRLDGKRFEGNGLGLSIVKQIAERHGGSAWAQANPEGGASFHFSLPRQPAQAVDAGRGHIEETHDA